MKITRPLSFPETWISLTRDIRPAMGMVLGLLPLLPPIWLHIQILLDRSDQIPGFWTFLYWGGSDLTIYSIIQSLSVGAITIAGVWLTYRRVLASDNNAEAANLNARFAELGHWSDRFTEATNLLRSDDPIQTGAGVAMLGEVAAAQPERYRVNSIRMLEAFIRTRRGGPRAAEEQAFPAEMQLALTTLGVLQRAEQLGEIDLSSCNFNGAVFSGTWSYVRFSQATFEGAVFSRTVFENCNFYQARLDVTARHTRFYRCDFTLANFDYARPGVGFGRCDFIECDFDGTSIVGQTFSFCQFEGCSWVGADISGTRFVPAEPMDAAVIRALSYAEWSVINPPHHTIQWDDDAPLLEDLLAQARNER